MKLLFIREIVGKSMLPKMEPGRIVVASSIKTYKPGSVVIAEVDGREVIKRISRINADKIWLISDNLAEGRDSRHYGPIFTYQILGTTLCCF
jgi:SOS-response transcriptional repressor LexA